MPSAGSSKLGLFLALGGAAALLLVGVVVLAVVIFASRGRPTASDVCRKLVNERIARNCRQTVPRGVSVRATQRYDFDLVYPSGKTGTVLSHATLSDYNRTVDLYRITAILVGPHRYGSSKALVFVQLNEKASSSVGSRVRAIVDGL